MLRSATASDTLLQDDEQPSTADNQHSIDDDTEGTDVLHISSQTSTSSSVLLKEAQTATEKSDKIFPTNRRAVVLLPRQEPFVVLKSWEGVVTSVGTETFFAAMRSLDDDKKRAETEFEVDLSEVLSGDRDLVREGAIFYLTVGISYPKGGIPGKTTRIVFRRMPRWSTQDIKRAEAATDKLMRILNP